MSTMPIAPIVPIPAVVTKTESWLKTHERIVIIALVLIFGTFLTQKYFNHEAAVADAKVVATQQALDNQNATDKQLAAQVAATTAQYEAMVTQLNSQNAALLATIKSDNAALAQRQTVDKSLTDPELIARWTTLVPDAGVSISGNEIVSTDAGAHQTVAALEQIPTLTDELAKQTEVTSNVTTELTSSQTVNQSLTTQVAGLQIAAKDAAVACQAEVSKVKSDARKHRLKTFFEGVGVGIGVGIYAVLHI